MKNVPFFIFTALFLCSNCAQKADQTVRWFQLKCRYDRSLTGDSLDLARRAVNDFATISGELARTYHADFDSIRVCFQDNYDDCLCDKGPCNMISIEVFVCSKPTIIPKELYCTGHYLCFHINKNGLTAPKACARNIFGTGNEIKKTIFGYGFFKTDVFNYL